MALSVRDFLHVQLFLDIPKPTASFSGKTIIITGANSGLGKEAAKHIVALSASKVILACRSVSSGKAAKLEIETALKCRTDVLEVWELDLESDISVKAFANRVNHLPQLDVLINNAGISAEKFSLVYGTERTLGVNVIGTFLLSLLVLPKLRETAKKFNTTPHMTFVGSAMHSTANYPKKFDGDFFTWSCEKENVNLNNQYALSKYIQLLLVNKLASHIDPLPSTTSKESNKIIINSLDPCFCGTTGLFRDVSGGKRIFLKIFNLFSRTPEKGSRLIVGAAAAGRETHGGWLRAGEVRETVEMVRGVEGVERGERVWRDLVGRVEGLGVGVGGLVEG